MVHVLSKLFISYPVEIKICLLVTQRNEHVCLHQYVIWLSIEPQTINSEIDTVVHPYNGIPLSHEERTNR